MTMDLRDLFITTERPYKEGAVEVFAQAIPAGAVEKATLTVTALGVYEAELNGRKVGDVLFAPGYTYYPRELQVQTYDVTDLLGRENALKVYLGQGWYCGRFTFDNKTKIYGDRPAVAWMLTVTRPDGSEHVYTSRDQGVIARPSPYGYAGLYDGEVYYAYGADAPVLPPVPYTGKLPEVFDETIVSVRVREEMPVKAVIPRGDRTILDFGQNFAGFVVIDPTKMAGDVLTVRHGEILNPDGSLYTNNLRKAKATVEYHKGQETKLYRPRFTYMGFRYAELSGVPYEEGLVTAYAVHSDMGRTGDFSCGREDVTKLYENQVWGQKSNYVEVPTDCPQRDERMGYTGDGQVFALTGSYNFDTEAFWTKFLRDIRYSQLDNKEGYVAPTIPAQGPAGVGFMSMLGWGNCDLIVPEMLYWQFGSDRHLRAQYDSMKAFVDCEIRHMGGLLGKKDLWMGPSLGDWLTLGKDVKYMAMHNGPVSNAFLVNDLRILSETARRLDKPEDAERYAAQLTRSRAAYIKAFVKPDGTMKDDYQGAYVLALRYVLEAGELWDKVFAKLIEKLRAEGMQTGFFATEHLLPLLADHGEATLAYDLLLSERCPGWLYQVQRGATTTWERWDALRPDGTVNEDRMSSDNMASFNHYAFGSVGEFYYRYILGIRPLEPGFSKVLIAPVPDPRLKHAKGSYTSRAGLIRSAWKYQKDRIVFDVAVPAPAEIRLPDGTVHAVEKGTYRYEVLL